MNNDRRTFLAGAAGAFAAGVFAGCSMHGARAEPAPFGERRRFVPTAFGEIACVVRGTGPAALFLHGFPLNADQWRDSIAKLAAHRTCVAPDFLGLGYTRVAAEQDVGPDSQVRMLVALLDALGLQAVDVIANDSGGAVAQLLVVRHPARVRTLLLTNCDTEIESPPAALLPVIEMSKQGRFVDEWLAPWLADPGLARSAQGIGGMCYANAAHPTDAALRSYFAPLVTSADRKRRVHEYAMSLERNPLSGIAGELRACRVPARIVWGMDDTIFAPENAEYLDRTLGNSRGVRRLENAKLFWPEERPDVIAAQARILWESASA
jgi:haloalkane dehalogenase